MLNTLSGSKKRGTKHFKNEGFLKSLGLHCKRLRSQKGFSIDRLAKESEQLSSSVIHRLENGSGAVTVLALLRYSEGLGIPLRDLVDIGGGFQEELQLKSTEKKILSVMDPRVKEGAYSKYFPVYSTQEFVDHFGVFEEMKPLGWVELKPQKKLEGLDLKKMFVLQFRGNAMVPKIRKDDLAVFGPESHGGREGKILLVQNRGGMDAEFGGPFTIRVFYTARGVVEDLSGVPKKQVTLSPLNPDYESVTVLARGDTEPRVFGEFLFVVS